MKNQCCDSVQQQKKLLFEVNKDDKSGLTVMTTLRADGVAMKPFIIYPYERVPSSLIASFLSNNATLAATKSGWMNSKTFCLYMEAVVKEMKEQNIQFPVLFFLDNPSSHATLEACETAKKLGMEMVFVGVSQFHFYAPASGCRSFTILEVSMERRKSSPEAR